MLDRFAGLGSTAVACTRLDVDCLAVDIDEVSLGEAVRRVTAGTASTPA